MNEPIIQGILSGLLLSVLIGPLFFVIIETSISKGIKAALFVDLGVLLSDAAFIVIAYISTAEKLNAQAHSRVLAIIGGVIFIGFGLFNILAKAKPVKEKDPNITSKHTYMLYTLKGFVLNIFNPSVLLFWFAMVVFAGQEFNNNDTDVKVFFICMLSVFFTIDLLKIIGARQLKRFITPHVLRRINQVTGIILAIFGIILLVTGITDSQPI